MRYTESYYNLSHGTDKISAENIKTKGFVLSGDDTFDLRVKKDLEKFEGFVNLILPKKKIIISEIDDAERKIRLRSALISFYAKETQCKLVIGNFRQRPQPLYEHAIEFANSLDMVFGIETIYCVKDTGIMKDTGIISNIRIGGK